VAVAVVLVLATIVAWCVVAARVEARGLTAPIVFVAVGFVLGTALDLADHPPETEVVRVIAEVTLVWVLFADASKVRLVDFRSDLGIYVRLLGVGLPLAVLLGALAAALVLDVQPWAALLLGAALAPTDAALGASVMSNPSVPQRIRRTLNVESGLNDGIVTPVVLVALAGVAADEGIGGLDEPAGALVALLVGVGVGVALGGIGGRVTRWARARGWLTDELGGPAALTLALLAYAVCLLVDGNGFVAAFVCGLVFGNVAGRGGAKEVYFVDQLGSLAGMVSWLFFGALAVPVIGGWVTWQTVCYAALSLTVLRMLPVAMALVGAELQPRDVLFIGWFGPRGLASVVFALLTFEGLGAAGRELVAVIALTVTASVVLHGVTAGRLTGRPRPDHAAASGS
jgi:NhaP-type Na+/H+ or K+/H+ antiporter